ncbi:MAG: DUF4345 domain-containing protein [Bacteroidetes bacterium]|nr:DUF4345 domain-containing protein [Bacteroidota bacterium]
MFLSQRVTQICLFLFAAIAIFGGCVQMYLGEPDTTPRLDNIHRFLSGIYLGCGFICGWTALTIQKQNTLVFLICTAVFLSGIGRLISMNLVGLPEPRGLWLGYVSSEIIVPITAFIGQIITNRKLQIK